MLVDRSHHRRIGDEEEALFDDVRCPVALTLGAAGSAEPAVSYFPLRKLSNLKSTGPATAIPARRERRSQA